MTLAFSFGIGLSVSLIVMFVPQLLIGCNPVSGRLAAPPG